MLQKILAIATLVSLKVVWVAQIAEACTPVVYKGPNDTVITGRTMDFSLEIPANLWIFPQGVERNGEVGPNSIEWTSRYGSYFFETALMPNTFWVDLNNIDFSEGTGARVLRVTNGEVYAGEVSDEFVSSEPFQFQGI